MSMHTLAMLVFGMSLNGMHPVQTGATGEGYTFASTSFETCPGNTSIPYTDLDDPMTDHELLNNACNSILECCQPWVAWPATATELGFSTWFYTNGGEGLTDGDYVGVTNYTDDVEHYPDGTQGYEMTDTDGIVELRINTVLNPGTPEWYVTLELFASDARWEDVDHIDVFLILDNGIEASIYSASGNEIEDDAGAWQSLSFDLTTYNEATLHVRLESTWSDEKIYIDQVQFHAVLPNDDDEDGIADEKDNCPLFNPDQADCNDNDIGDTCDIQDGSSTDCNGNGVPDECEPDCNGNGIADACDISNGLSSDLDADGQPDECGNCTGDINKDNQVDVNDLLEIIANWGTCEPGRMNGDSTGLLDRSSPADVRVMTWNTPEFLPASMSEAERAPFIRVLLAIHADVIVFQEFEHDEDVAALGDWLDEHVRSGPWQIHEGAHDAGADRNVIASYMPLDMLATNTIPGPLYPLRGVTMARVDCPDEYWSTDLYLMGVHLKAFGDCLSILKKQDAADSIANWIGDLRTPGGEVDLPQDTLVVLLGDTNFYTEGDQPERTLLTGDILNEARYGADIKGDWDETDLVDLQPIQPGSGDTWTWWESNEFDASRTDRVIVTNSVMHRHNSFTLNTTVLPEDVLDAYGLEIDDTTRDVTSDHLPVVVDFRDPQYCQADLNHDGTVDVNDLLLVIGAWGPCP